MAPKPIRARPYGPRPHGKAERYGLRQTSSASRPCRPSGAEWAYAMAFRSSEKRNARLPRYLAIPNARKCPMALGGPSPQQRPAMVLAE